MNVQPDRTLIRTAAGSTRYVLVTFDAPDAPRAARPPVNVAFVLDRSGSMGGRKIELARMALVRAVRMLRPSDRFSVVFYDHEFDLLVPSTQATKEAVANAVRQIEAVQARGSTNLGGGWLMGCEQIAPHLSAGQVARCLLVTDGLANEGIVDPGELARRAGELRAQGISTSTLSIGLDFNETLLQQMADAGGGHAYHVETPVQIGDLLTSELREAIGIVARDVTVTVRTSTGVDVNSLNAFAVSARDDDAAISLGDLVSGQGVALVVRLRFPAGAEGATASVLFGVSDAGGVLAFAPRDGVWTCADDAANDRQPRDIVVDRAVARLYAARAREEAFALNEAGRYGEARRRLEAVAHRIREYAGQDPELLALVEELLALAATCDVPLAAPALKAGRYASYNLSRMRDTQGRARRRPEQP